MTALNIAISGIRTNATQLEQVASNISNAVTPGYTRKTVTTAPVVLGAAGSGVLITGFVRAENRAMFTTLSRATSTNGYFDGQNGYLQQVMDLLGISNTDNPTLSATLADFVNAWNNLAATPESQVNQRQVVNTATSFCVEVNRLANEVENLDRQCHAEIDSLLKEMNSYLEQIYDLNVKISQAQNAGLSSGDLQDQRDQIIMMISDITEVAVFERPSGQVALYTRGGYQLVDGAAVRAFSYDGTHVYGGSDPTLVLDNVLMGGRLQALVYFRATAPSTVTAADVDAALVDVNNYLAQIQTLNTQIVALGGDATLEADRAALITQLQAIIPVTATTNPDFSVTLRGLSNTILLQDNPPIMANLAFDGTHVYDTSNPTVSLNAVLMGGSLGAQLSSLGGITSVSTDGGTNVIQKLRSQLDEVVAIFTDVMTSATSGQDSFAAAYNNVIGVPGNLDADFFVGTDRTTFRVNDALVNGSATLKIAAAQEVMDALVDSTRAFTADGISVVGASYSTFLTSSFISFQQAANNTGTLFTTANNLHAFMEKKFTDETGVNTDDELIKLVEFQHAYAASARVISTVREMFITIHNMVS
ncbi:MAG: flagellar hook-associated protein FlgK [Alphaproteobacteria bacterium]|nr:flagellar hook-associated protein FlgK [Alphaproteobacteria bacterium]